METRQHAEAEYTAAEGRSDSVGTTVFGGMIVIFAALARRKGAKPRGIRRIEAYESLPATVGAAVETGRRIHISLGSGTIGEVNTAATISGLGVLDQVASVAAVSDKPRGIHNYRLEALSADVLELIRAFEREKAIVVGHDWGGVVAWHLAMHHPEIVEKLIVMNAPHPIAFARELNRSWSQRAKSWYMTFFQLPWLPEALFSITPLAAAKAILRRTIWRAL